MRFFRIRHTSFLGLGYALLSAIFASTTSWAADLDAMTIEKVDRWLDAAPKGIARRPEERDAFKSMVVMNTSSDMFRCVIQVANLKGQRAMLERAAPGVDIPDGDAVYSLPTQEGGVATCQKVVAKLKEQISLLAKK